MTLIDRAGMFGAADKSLADGIEMPLAFFFLDSLSVQEQMELFPHCLKLSIYAATITHLKWYETAAFANLLQILAIVVAIVITVITFGAASSFGAFLVSMTEMMAIGLVAGYAMKLLMESGAPDWLKAVGAVIIVVAAIYAGNSNAAGEFLNASQLTTAVTQSAYVVIGTSSAALTQLANGFSVYTQVKMDKLDEESDRFNKAAELRQNVIDDTFKNLHSGLDVFDIQWLQDREIPAAYLQGPDAFMYRAKGNVQYNYGALYDYGPHKDDFVDSRLNLGIK